MPETGSVLRLKNGEDTLELNTVDHRYRSQAGQSADCPNRVAPREYLSSLTMQLIVMTEVFIFAQKGQAYKDEYQRLRGITDAYVATKRY